MKIAFGILSSTEHPGAVAQLADALGTAHPIVVHHDFGKQPSACRPRPNLRFVPLPARTGWGEWSLCEAVLRLVEAALKDREWEYFQLLSGSCLPVQPIAAFEAFVARRTADVHMDLAGLDTDADLMMSHGWRAYAPAGTLRIRLLLRLRAAYLGGHAATVSRHGLGVALPANDGPRSVRARLAASALRAARRVSFGGRLHPFADGLGCFVGSTWFGASRSACEYLVSRRDDDRLRQWFRQVHAPDEFYFQTVFGNADFEIAESNHLVAPFQGAHPARWAVADLPALLGSGRFFARKFPDHPDAPVRRAVLEQIGALPARTAQPVWRGTAPPRGVAARTVAPRPAPPPTVRPPVWWPTTTFRPG